MNKTKKKTDNKCLSCYNLLEEGEKDYHKKCLKIFFNLDKPPVIPFEEKELKEMGKEIISERISVTGVQPKLSLDIKKIGVENKITVVGFKGMYILKIPVEKYPMLPEFEDVTMHLAEASGIETVKHTLVRMKSGEPAFLTKRIDRTKKGKIHMEDMCQLTERQTSAKYKGSYEQIAKKILQFSAAAGLDIINFSELLVFCFLTGNSDMHLKNFSLLEDAQKGVRLSPAYDLVPSNILLKDDKEETALSLNEKKSKLQRKDFEVFFESIAINKKAGENIFTRFRKSLPRYYEIIKNSFLTNKYKKEYIDLIDSRAERLEIV